MTYGGTSVGVGELSMVGGARVWGARSETLRGERRVRETMPTTMDSLVATTMESQATLNGEEECVEKSEHEGEKE